LNTDIKDENSFTMILFMDTEFYAKGIQAVMPLGDFI